MRDRHVSHYTSDLKVAKIERRYIKGTCKLKHWRKRLARAIRRQGKAITQAAHLNPSDE